MRRTKIIIPFLIASFLCQNVSFGIPERHPALRLPMQFGNAADSNEVKNLKLASGGTLMKGRLGELRTMVTIKLEEYDRVATSPEEKLDRERAIKRIKSLFTIGEFLIRLDAKLFKQYINEVARPMLKLDVRSVNFILASRIGDSFIGVSDATKLPVGKTFIGEYIKIMINRKKDWHNKFYYLPGLPIVVEAQGLSDENMERLNRAASLIVNSGWLNIRPETLSYVEAIIPEVKSNLLLGHARRTGRDINVSVQEQNSKTIAITIIHEGAHKYAERTQFIHKDELDSRIIQHRFSYLKSENKTAKALLHELYAYGAELQFQLHLIKVYKPKELSIGLINSYYSLIVEAQKLVSTLEKIGYRKDSVNTLKELWDNLSVPVEHWKELADRATISALKEVRASI